MRRYALWSLVGPEAWAVWAAAIALVALLLRRRRSALGAIGFALAWQLAVFFLPVGYALIEPLETRFPPPASTAGTTDILVLAGGEHLAAAFRHHRPEYGETGDRIIAGAMLAHALPGARLWIVGGVRGHPGEPRDVDWTMEAWARLGVAPTRIHAVGGTTDTCGNALGVAHTMPPGARALLVTSAFHMPRSVACFRAAGLAPVPYPVDFVNGVAPAFLDGGGEPALNHWRLDCALHEYAGLLYYRLGGRIRELWPAPQPRISR